LKGRGTHFTKFVQPRSTIGFAKSEEFVMVHEIISDTELLLAKPFTNDIAVTLLESVDENGEPKGTRYTITPYVDQSQMFKSVVQRLTKNQAVGIFPEGGSHDRSELLPLKAGVAVMALETLSKFPGVKLKVIPAGLHYFHSDTFRSRSVIEYGKPIEIPLELVDQYNMGGADKRKAIGLLLDTINIRLNALTLQASDFDSLMVFIVNIGCSSQS
jgi:glycerol-3-phosphate O-acyltransferase/dihydroxyacetone phosphate acyltransferase